ncbi:hypothetical protein TNCV_1811131, partial [Trichonephila clavipes]
MRQSLAIKRIKRGLSSTDLATVCPVGA